MGQVLAAGRCRWRMWDLQLRDKVERRSVCWSIQCPATRGPGVQGQQIECTQVSLPAQAEPLEDGHVPCSRSGQHTREEGLGRHRKATSPGPP